MNKKTLIIYTVVAFLGIAIGGIGGWFVGSLNRPIKPIIDKPNATVVFNNDDSIGTIKSYNDLENLRSENSFSFKVNLRDSNKTINYVTINENKYIANNELYFSFILNEGANEVDITYEDFKEDANFFAFGLNKNPQNQINGETHLVGENGGQVNILGNKERSVFTLSLNPNDKYKIGYVKVVNENNSYNISFNSSKVYNFFPKRGDNEITVSYILENGTIDNAYDSFKEFIEGKDITTIDFSSSDVLSKFSIADLSRISFSRVQELETYEAQSYYYAYSVAVGIKNNQDTNTSIIKNKENFFKENITFSSNVQMAERSINKGDKNINKYQITGDKVSGATTVDFTSPKETTMSIDEYNDKYGLSLFQLNNYSLYDNYVLKNSQIINEKEFSSSIIKDTDGYVISMNLDIKSAYNYSKYMFTTTDYEGAPALVKQKDYPVFSKCGIEIHLNSELYPTYFLNRDEYVVKALVDAKTLGKGRTNFNYTSKAEIPSLDESLTYPKIESGDLD